MAMSSSRVRRAVRDAMRASPWAEHKIDFQAFVRSPEGEGLRTALADLAGLEEGDLLAALDDRGPLEFYVPERDDRIRWKADRELEVVDLTGAEPMNELVAYGIDGSAISPTGFGAVLFAIGPAEEAFTGEPFRTITYNGPAIHAADECHPYIPPGCDSAGDGGVVIQAEVGGTWLGDFLLFDQGDPLGSAEIEFFYFLEGSINDPNLGGTPKCKRFTGIDEDIWYTLNLKVLVEETPNFNSRLVVHWHEDDSQGCVPDHLGSIWNGFNGDDDLGATITGPYELYPIVPYQILDTLGEPSIPAEGKFFFRIDLEPADP